MDRNKTGTLSFDEIQRCLHTAGYNYASREIALIISNADQMGNGSIDYSDFLAATLSARINVREEDLWEVFSHFDMDNTDFISPENLSNVMKQAGKEVTSEEIDDMIQEVARNKDGNIRFDDFVALMLPCLKSNHL